MLIQKRSCLLWMQRRHPHPLSWSARGLDTSIFKTLAASCYTLPAFCNTFHVATSCHELNKWRCFFFHLGFSVPVINSKLFQLPTVSKDQVTWQLTSRWQAMGVNLRYSKNLGWYQPSPQGRVPIDVQPLCRMEHCPKLCQLTRSGVSLQC